MSEPYDCPCGAHVTDPDGAITYVTDTLIDAVLDGVVGASKYFGLFAPLAGSVLDVEDICAAPKERMPEFSLADFAQIPLAFVKIAQLLRVKVYELNCTCDECPPVTDCGEGTCITLDAGDGYLPDPDQPAVREYHIPTGTEVWAARVADGHCIGFLSGVTITWHTGGVFDPANGVSVCNGGGGSCFSWSQNILAGTVQLCIGGTPSPPTEPVPPVPPGVDDWYGPAPCTDSDICVVLDELAEKVRRIEFLTTVVTGPLYGVTSPYEFTFPGLNTPIVGTLVDALPRALSAIAPIQPSQLVNETIIPISTSTSITLTGLAYLEITPTTVPGTFGAYGEPPTRVFHSRTRSPSPGYALVLGQEGVLDQRFILWDQGIEIVVPSTATDLLLHLEPGVEVDVVTYERHV